MLLRYVPLDEQGEDVAKSQALFESAFPEDERPPFSMILDWDHSTFFGVYRQDEYVGLVDLIRYQDMVYVFFLAISESFRNQGIGSQILSDLKKKYRGRRLFLLAEETGPRYSDNVLRERRLGFYARNGFLPTGDTVLEFGVRYLLLCSNKRVSKNEFVATMASLIGDEYAKRIYAHV